MKIIFLSGGRYWKIAYCIFSQKATLQYGPVKACIKNNFRKLFFRVSSTRFKTSVVYKMTGKGGFTYVKNEMFDLSIYYWLFINRFHSLLTFKKGTMEPVLWSLIERWIFYQAAELHQSTSRYNIRMFTTNWRLADDPRCGHVKVWIWF